MESQPQNPEFRINPGNFHPCRKRKWIVEEQFPSYIIIRNFKHLPFVFKTFVLSIFERPLK